MTVIRYGIDALAVGALDGLIALGIGLVFGLMRLVNFAHGDMITWGAYAYYMFAGLAGLSFGLAVPLVLLFVMVLALLLERVAFRPMRAADPMTLLVSSFAVSYILQNSNIMIFGSLSKSVATPGFFSQTLSLGGLGLTTVDVVSIGATLVLLVGLRLFLERTRLGLQMLAAASDFTMARLLGVRANRVIAAAFAISGLLAAVVSIIFVAQLGGFDQSLGIEPVLIGFAGVIVGGMGSLVGATLGGFLIGFITIVLQEALPTSLSPFRDAFVFSIVIVFLLFRPQGIITSRYVAERV